MILSGDLVHTAAIARARDAYDLDRHLEDHCATCLRRRRDGHHTDCWTCRRGEEPTMSHPPAVSTAPTTAPQTSVSGAVRIPGVVE